MRRKTSVSPTRNETRSSSASRRSRPSAITRASASLRKKPRSERITTFTAIRLSSCSTGSSYSCSKSRKRPPASLSRQSDTIVPCTAWRISASCASGAGTASLSRRKRSIASWTTLPAQSGSADSFLRRRISSSSSAA